MFSPGYIYANPVVASTISYISSSKGAASSASTASTTPFDSSGSNFVAVAVGTETATATVTDNKGNTYTLVRTDVTSGDFLKTYYCFGATVGPSHIISVSSSSGFPAIATACFTGVTASPLDQQSGLGAVGATSIQPGSITPSISGCLIISGTMTDFASTFPTPAIDSGFILAQYSPLSGSSVGCGIAYLIQGAAAAVNPNWSGYAPGHCIASNVSFK